MKEKNKVHPVDLYVGTRIRQRRNECKMTQEFLANQLGISFQQVQKYERGFNRVGASRLYEIAVITETPIAWFFAGYADGETPPKMMLVEFISGDSNHASDSEITRLLQCFCQIADPQQRQRAYDIIATYQGTKLLPTVRV